MRRHLLQFAENCSRSSIFNLNFAIFNFQYSYLLPVRSSLLTASALSAALVLASCEFRSRRPAYKFGAGVTLKLRYSAEIRAKAEGAWGAAPYVSAARAEFTLKAADDSAKGQADLSLSTDTLSFRADERSPEENAYMDGRLRKYGARLTLSRTGQMISLEEEPALPPVAFSPLNVARWLVYALPAFPDAPLRQGARWEIDQPLLDKFHPGARVLKRYTLSAIRETPEGDLATCLVDLQVWLGEDLGQPDADASGAPAPSLTGTGKVVFNLAKGRPESAELELEGKFPADPGKAPGDTSQAAAEGVRERLLDLQEKVEISISD